MFNNFTAQRVDFGRLSLWRCFQKGARGVQHESKHATGLMNNVKWNRVYKGNFTTSASLVLRHCWVKWARKGPPSWNEFSMPNSWGTCTKIFRNLICPNWSGNKQALKFLKARIKNALRFAASIRSSWWTPRFFEVEIITGHTFSVNDVEFWQDFAYFPRMAITVMIILKKRKKKDKND